MWSRRYDDLGTIVCVGRGALEEINSNPETYAIVDTGIGRAGMDILRAAIGPDAVVLEIHGGSGAKTLESYGALISRLYESGATRRALLVCAGGGAVLDLGGFIAATYMRGIRHINVPTTLLGMVDSGLGGKNGLDCPGKNTIGTFYMPEAIYCDTRFLETLPRQEVASGMAEVVKCGLVCRPEVLEMLDGWPENSEELIAMCAEAKMDVVAGDMYDTKGQRAVLNFGHTLGHALEMSKGLPHGFAVAMGMRFAVKLSTEQGLMSTSEAGAVLALIDKWCPTARLDGLTVEGLVAHMRRDKKNTGTMVMVLLQGPGRPVIAALEEGEITRPLESFLGEYG